MLIFIGKLSTKSLTKRISGTENMYGKKSSKMS